MIFPNRPRYRWGLEVTFCRFTASRPKCSKHSDSSRYRNLTQIFARNLYLAGASAIFSSTSIPDHSRRRTESEKKPLEFWRRRRPIHHLRMSSRVRGAGPDIIIKGDLIFGSDIAGVSEDRPSSVSRCRRSRARESVGDCEHRKPSRVDYLQRRSLLMKLVNGSSIKAAPSFTGATVIRNTFRRRGTNTFGPDLRGVPNRASNFSQSGNKT